MESAEDTEVRLGIDINKVNDFINRAGTPKVKAFNILYDNSYVQDLANLTVPSPMCPTKLKFILDPESVDYFAKKHHCLFTVLEGQETLLKKKIDELNLSVKTARDFQKKKVVSA